MATYNVSVGATLSVISYSARTTGRLKLDGSSFLLNSAGGNILIATEANRQVNKAAALYRGAVVTSTGTLRRTASHLIAAVIASTGTMRRAISKVKTHILTWTGVPRRAMTRAIAAVLTSAGTTRKTVLNPLPTAVITSTGTNPRKPLKPIAAVIASSSMMRRAIAFNVRGTMTFLGRLVRMILDKIFGYVTSALPLVGSLKRATATSRTSGVITSIGTFWKSIPRYFSGAIASTGTERRTAGKIASATIASTGTHGPRAIAKVLRGTQTFLGLGSHGLVFLIAAVLSTTGTTRRALARAIAAVIASTGTTRKTLGRAIAASLSSSGGFRKRALKVAAGIMGFTGLELRALGFHVAGVQSTAGPLTKAVATARTSGVLSSTGTDPRTVVKAVFAAVLATIGTLRRGQGKVLSGSISSTGVPRRTIAKVVSGIITSLGRLIRMILDRVAGYITSAQPLVGTLQRAIATARTSGVMTSTGTLRRTVLIPIAAVMASATVMQRNASKVISGVWFPQPPTRKRILRPIAAVIQSTGTVRRTWLVFLTAALTTAGTMKRGTALSLGRILTMTGHPGKNIHRGIFGGIASGGTFANIYGIGILSTLAFAGILTRRVLKLAGGATQPIGTRLISGTMAGEFFAILRDHLQAEVRLTQPQLEAVLWDHLTKTAQLNKTAVASLSLRQVVTSGVELLGILAKEGYLTTTKAASIRTVMGLAFTALFRKGDG